MDKKYEKDINQVRGALYGVAIGDALGAPLENMTYEEINGKYGIVDGIMDRPAANWRAGETTDDTDMMLCVAAGIIEKPVNPISAIGKHFVAWLHSSPKDVGLTCALAISAYERLALLTDMDADTEKKWVQAAMTTNAQLNGQSGGNGALMRCIYPAFAYGDKNKAISVAQEIGRMTHVAAESDEAIKIYISIIHDLRIGMPLVGAVLENIKGTQYEKLINEPVEPTGYVVNTLACALWAVLHAGSFEQAVILTVNLGGDTDTIGAVAGGIAGSAYGWDKIPCRWVRALAYPLQLLLDHFSVVTF